MIKSYADSRTESLMKGTPVRGVSGDLRRRAKRRLLILDAAVNINDLRSPPGNRLEKLKGDRDGQHSIRINKQWRICFRWRGGDAFDVEFCDYH